MHKILASWVVLFFAVGAATAQDAVERGGDRGADALRGPEVPERARRTLLHRSMTGQFQRVPGRPEAAAVQMLDLDEGARARVAEVIDARAMAVAMLLVEEIDAVKVISDAVIAEENERAQELTVALWKAFEPASPRSPLLEPLKTVLSAEDHAEVSRLTDEYWEGLLDWQLRGRARAMERMDEDEVRALRDETEERLAFQLFQREVRVGYDATLLRYRQAMEALYEAVEPTDAQREVLRTILVEHIRETQLQPTPEQRREANRKMYDSLDEKRRGKMFDYLLLRVIPDEGGG